MLRLITARGRVDVGFAELKFQILLCVDSLGKSVTTQVAGYIMPVRMSCIQITDQYCISIVLMQSIKNINRYFIRWRRIDNSQCVFFIGVEYIGSDEIIDVIEFGSESVRNFSSDS